MPPIEFSTIQAAKTALDTQFLEASYRLPSTSEAVKTIVPHMDETSKFLGLAGYVGRTLGLLCAAREVKEWFFKGTEASDTMTSPKVLEAIRPEILSALNPPDATRDSVTETLSKYPPNIIWTALNSPDTSAAKIEQTLTHAAQLLDIDPATLGTPPGADSTLPTNKSPGVAPYAVTRRPEHDHLGPPLLPPTPLETGWVTERPREKTFAPGGGAEEYQDGALSESGDKLPAPREWLTDPDTGQFGAISESAEWGSVRLTEEWAGAGMRRNEHLDFDPELLGSDVGIPKAREYHMPEGADTTIPRFTALPMTDTSESGLHATERVTDSGMSQLTIIAQNTQPSENGNDDISETPNNTDETPRSEERTEPARSDFDIEITRVMDDPEYVDHNKIEILSGNNRDSGINGIQSGNKALIQGIYVDEPYREKGTGRALVRAFEQIVKEKGAETITVKSHPSAAGFWEKLGYSCQKLPTDGSFPIFRKTLAP